MKFFDQSLKNINSNCDLGEGLYISNDSIFWVDINNNIIFNYVNNHLNKYRLNLQPSVILNNENHLLMIGTDHGIFEINLSASIENCIKINDPQILFNHDIASYRSNDGGICNSNTYLSFMHRTDPNKNKGYIYRYEDNKYILQEDSLNIPNSFISLSKDIILVSDSLNSIIWKFQLDENGNFIKKTLWTKLPSNISPDGGCIINDHIFIALWDDASIGIFDFEGYMVDKINLPIIRPTNCKYDPIESNLWITSASESLSKDDLRKYPMSGSTLSMKVEV